MVYDFIILRYGEMFLKGKNKSFFERRLISNVQRIISKGDKIPLKIKRTQGRLLINYFPTHSRLRRVFGLASYSPSFKVNKSLEEIQRKAVELLQGKKGTFRVYTKRSDKSFPVTSLETNALIGKYVETHSDLIFSMHQPEIALNIEINQEGAYLFFETIPCSGGLPAGVEGKVVLLVENETSLLAGLLFMKRGCSLLPVAFENMNISLLQEFSPTELQLEIVQNHQELEGLAAKNEISILVTGQVLEDKNYKTSLTIMKPLIAYSKKHIQEQLKWFRSLV